MACALGKREKACNSNSACSHDEILSMNTLCLHTLRKWSIRPLAYKLKYFNDDVTSLPTPSVMYGRLWGLKLFLNIAPEVYRLL